jgi:hypothetical protein
MTNDTLVISVSLAFVTLAVSSCGESAPPPPPPDPARCEIADLGEASDLIAKGPLPDDKMVRVTGISSPKSLVWQDAATKQAHFVSRVIGAEGRWLYYMQELGVGETPKVLSEFEGHLRRWEELPQKQAVPMAAALERDYKIKIDPANTWLITNGAKPEGCP